jgi:hypothetical protein
MSSDNTANARALASRQNGARPRGPRTAAGWARTARNALKHGLRARRLALLDDEDASEFRAFRAALGLGLMRDGKGPRALETLVRYRGSVHAELFRALAALRLLQADARAFPENAPPDAAPALLPPPRATTKRTRESASKQSLGFRAGA